MVDPSVFSSEPVPAAVSRFCSNYLIWLDKAAMPVNQRRWYVKRIEDFIKAQSGRKIKTLTAIEVNQYR